jgi:hypothetical protein
VRSPNEGCRSRARISLSRSRLRFNPSPCTTTTGLLNPGPEPAGSGRRAHRTSPWETTTRFALKCDGRKQIRTRPSNFPTRRRLDPWRWLCLPGHAPCNVLRDRIAEQPAPELFRAPSEPFRFFKHFVRYRDRSLTLSVTAAPYRPTACRMTRSVLPPMIFFTSSSL